MARDTAEIDRFLREAVDRGDLPGVVALVAGKGDIRYQGAFGKLDGAATGDLPGDAIFRIMSMTKPVTSVMVMALHEAGQLDLADPISRYLPRLKEPTVEDRVNPADGSYTTRPARREITIRDLLTHTAGFGYAFSNHTARLLEEQAGKPPDALPLLHQPGDRWTYGPSTRILGELVETLCGNSLEAVFQERVFGPLGMPDTSYHLPREQRHRWMAGHQRVGGVLREQPRPEVEQPVFRGDGGLFSTGPDYIRFLQMLLNGGARAGVRILSEGSVALMTRNHIGDLVVEVQPGAIPSTSEAFPRGPGRDKFGLGFLITAAGDGDSPGEDAPRRAPGSYSWAGLYNTHFWVDPRREIAVVFLTQLLPFYDSTCMAALAGFEELVYRCLV